MSTAAKPNFTLFKDETIMEIGTKFSVMEKSDLQYYEATKHIINILVSKYGMDTDIAEKAVAESPLLNIFSLDSDMAAHTSNEAWARSVFDYWNKNHT